MAKQDIWIYPVDITNGRMVVKTTSQTATVTVPAGRYWAYSGNITGMPSLYAAIEQAFQTDAGITVLHDTSTPDPGVKHSGLSLYGPDPFGFHFADPAFSSEMKSILGAPGAMVNDPPSTEYSSPYSRFGAWTEPGCGGRRKQDNWHKVQFTGLGHFSATRSVQYWGGYKTTQFTYRAIPAALVSPQYSESDFHQVAGIQSGDVNNRWYNVWEYGISRYLPCIVIHDVPSLGLSGKYSIVYAGPDSDFASDFSQTVKERGEEAIVYDIDLLLEVK